MSQMPMPGGEWWKRGPFGDPNLGTGTGSNSRTSTDWDQRHPPLIAQRLRGTPEDAAGMNQNPQSIPNPGGQVPPPQAQVDRSKWDTDGYATPAFTATNPAGHPMPGWDREKWANTNHQTPKYTVGRILSQFAPSPENFKLAMAQIQQAYPGATMVGDDKLMIPGFSTPVDVGGSFSDGTNMKWHWGTQDKNAGIGMPTLPSGIPDAIAGPITGGTQMPDSDFFRRLMERIQSGGQTVTAQSSPTNAALAGQLNG